MKRKLIALTLAAAMLAALAGCGPADPDDQPDPSSDIQESLPPFNPNGMVLVDQNLVRITIDEYREQENGDVELELDVENTSDRDLRISAASCAVNGYMTSVFADCQVAAGETAYSVGLIIYMGDLIELGLTDVADVALRFSLDGADGSHRLVDAARITTPLASLYDYDASLLQKALGDPEWISTGGYQLLLAANEDLYDQDGVCLLTACVLADRYGTRQLRLELSHSGLDQAVVSLGDVAVNGVTLDPGNLARYAVASRKRCLVNISLDYLVDENDPQVDLSQLREVSLSVNDTPVTISIPS